MVTITFQVIRENNDALDDDVYQDLQEEFRKFYVWNDLFSTSGGELDNLLSASQNLKAAVLVLMLQWANALSRGKS